MAAPDVSVIIGAYNAMPYLVPCLQSVLDQTIGLDRLEVIVVDDGSTDDTGAEIDRVAALHPEHIRAIHQANSGGPSAPRNAGLEHATGRYVFFLDADDHLGTEALARLVAMADAQDSDVVLGKVVGSNRGAPASMFKENQPKADLFTSRVWWTLSAYKLFRRELLEREGLRFPTGYRIGEDQMFTSQAYLAARTISVVADYDCYYLVKRDDGSNITATDTDMYSRMAFLEEMCRMVADRVPAGPKRNHLFQRQFGYDLASYSAARTWRKPPEEQARILTIARRILEQWGEPELIERLPPAIQSRFALIRAGRFEDAMEHVRLETQKVPVDVVLDGATAYARRPGFRDPQLQLPDRLFDVTKTIRTSHTLRSLGVEGTHIRLTGDAALLAHLDERPTATLVLRDRASDRVVRVPTRSEAPSGEQGGVAFSTDLDLAAVEGRPLPRGIWDAFIELQVGAFRRELRLGSSRDEGVPAAIRARLMPLHGRRAEIVTTYFTTPASNLTIDIGCAKHPLRRFITPTLEPADGGWRVSGRFELAEVTSATVLRGRTGGRRTAVALHIEDEWMSALLPGGGDRRPADLRFRLVTGDASLTVPAPGAAGRGSRWDHPLEDRPRTSPVVAAARRIPGAARVERALRGTRLDEALRGWAASRR